MSSGGLGGRGGRSESESLKSKKGFEARSSFAGFNSSSPCAGFPLSLFTDFGVRGERRSRRPSSASSVLLRCYRRVPDEAEEAPLVTVLVLVGRFWRETGGPREVRGEGVGEGRGEGRELGMGGTG